MWLLFIANVKGNPLGKVKMVQRLLVTFGKATPYILDSTTNRVK